MSRHLLGTMALALSALALAAPQRYEMQSYVRVGGEVRPAFAWCDAPDRVLAVTRPATSELMTPQPVTLLQWPKQNPDQPYKAQYQLGPSEGAAGTVYTTLTPPGQTPSSTDTRNFVSISNVENVIDPHYRMTHVNEFRLDGQDHRCRYVPGAEFLGTTSRRTVIVWHSGDKVTYATRNFDGTPGVYVTGGKVAQDDIGPEYTFEADGYTYLLKFHPYAAFLLVQKDGKTLQTEEFLAYSISQPVKEQP